MTTIKFLGYDLNIDFAEITVRPEPRASYVTIHFLFYGRHMSFRRLVETSKITTLTPIFLYSLIYDEIENDMTDWVNSLT